MKGWADRQKKPDGTEVVYQGGVINSAAGTGAGEADHPRRPEDDAVQMPLH